MISKIAMVGLIIGGTLLTSIPTYAANVKTASTFQNSCPGANFNAEVYFSGDSMSKKVSPSDSFWTTDPAFILNGTTDIDVWNGNGGTSKCTDGWYRASNFSPGGSKKVNAFYNDGSCELRRNTNPNIPFTQIVFRVGYKLQTGFTSTTVPNQYWYYNTTSPTQIFISDQRTRVWGSPIQHSNECLNYYARWCGDGLLTNGESCDPAAPGQSSATCNPTTCKPITTPPTCNTAKTGTQSSPVLSTDALCTVGTVSGFTSTTSGNTTNYTWSCNTSTAVQCSANYTPTPAGPSIVIKKYAKDIANGDTQTAPISIAPGETFNYYYVLENTGSTVATGVVVKDTLPSYLTFTGTITIKNPSGQDVTNDWLIATGSKIFTGETLSRIHLIATKKTDLPATSGKYTFIVPVTLAQNVPLGVNMQNVVYACAANNSKNPTGPGGEDICNNPNPPPPPPPNQCDKTNPNSQKDPACIVPIRGFDLSLKKYLNTASSAATENDAQPGSGPSLTSGIAMNYIIRVRNEGPETTTGTTTVRDTLPTGVTLSGTVTGTSWTCTVSGADIGCTTTQMVLSGAYYTDITVPVRITAGAGTTVTNYAVVYNPNEENACKTDGSMPIGNETACTKDPKNIDPAQFTIPGGGGGGSNYYVPTCINSVASCATVAASSQGSCETTYGVGKCNTTIEACNTVKNSLSCGGGGGGGGGGGSIGRCGDGVLHIGEECDVPGAAWCTTSCRINLNTNPGANPITALSIRIPSLGKVGAAHFGKIPLTQNRVVIGQNTNVFTLNDEIMLDVQTQFAIPIMLPADRLICLASHGYGLNQNTVCNRADTYGRVTSINGQSYVVIGGGSYQVRRGDGTYYNQDIQSPISSLTLFKGYAIPQVGTQVTLNHAFLGTTSGMTGSITLYNRNPDTDAGGAIDLGSFEVRVSAARVGTTGTPVNRILESLVRATPQSLLSGFLQNTNTTTTISARTDTASAYTGTIEKISLNGITAYPSGLTVDEVTDIPALNGNPNIRAIKGNLTVICPNNASTPFSQVGVVSVVVDGTIKFNCNTAYPSGDMTSSWAWISQGGDITIDKSVTNIAGIYVAIPKVAGNTVDSGRFLGTETTNAILKVEGSLYGNANHLFASRLYARGTNAYDILTTGTILSYSNRALVNPPPLLSQYLGNYTVERVVK